MADIKGRTEPGFGRVADAFERCFDEYGDVGASVCVTVEGQIVADLWGGHADGQRRRPWGEHSLAVVFSATKGLATIIALRLVDAGKLDLDVPIATYWPDFAQNGKEHITLRQVMTHTAGLPFLDADLPERSGYYPQAMAKATEVQAPAWEPGTKLGYHAVTFGWIVGEVVRRVAGRTVGQLIQDEIAKPLDAEVFLGLPASRDADVVEWLMESAEDAGDGEKQDGTDGEVSPMQRAMNAAYLGDLSAINTVEFRRAEMPAANGLANGRGLAMAYKPLALGGTWDGYELLSGATIEDATEQRVNGPDVVLEIDNARRATGFKLMWPDMGEKHGRRTFGHGGYGGSLGCADPDARLSFGYVMNKAWGGGRGTDPRSHSLINAAYECLD